jgi:hypothetical protein
MANGTGKVDIGSDLVRKAWMSEGLIQKSATSFWAPYKGKTMDSIIMVENDISASKGHTVVFDFDGNLSGRPVKGNTTAKGKGEQKKKFSDKLTVSDYRYVVDNGTKFDGVNIGDLSINEHSDSRSKLADLWVRSEDQAFFDLGQQEAEFGLQFAAGSFDLDAVLKIETAVKTGTGFDVTPSGITRRLPLKPFALQGGEAVWIIVLDVAAKGAFLKQAGAGAVLQTADVRGNDNRLIKGVIGKIGSFLFVEAGTFFGETEGAITTNGYYNYENTGVEMAGLRQRDADGHWTGEADFDGVATTSRCLVLGAGAFQKANGMMPDYKYEATDFGKFSESCLETWCAAKPSKLVAENSDYKDGKVAGYNYGIVFVDVAL